MSEKRKGGPKPYPVRVRGVDFESVKACAAHFGISVHTIYAALNEGNADSIGLGKGRNKAITIGGIDFPSMQDASFFVGRSRSYVSSILKRGSTGRIERLEQEFRDLADRA